MIFTVSSKANINGKDHSAVHVAELKAGELIPACTPITIKADGNGNFRIFKAKAGDVFDGISQPRDTPAGMPCAIFGVGMRFHARNEADLAPGLYGLGAVAGQIDSAATTGVFRAVSKTDLQVISQGKTSA